MSNEDISEDDDGNGYDFSTELPEEIAENIASWRRTIAAARGKHPENVPSLLGMAAAELFGMGIVDPVVRQMMADDLYNIAEAAGIDPDETQQILARAHGADPRDFVNGHAVRTSLDDNATLQQRPVQSPPRLQWLDMSTWDHLGQ